MAFQRGHFVRDEHKEDGAEELLHQNLALPTIETSGEAYEKSLYLLANVLFAEGKYQQAADKFELALEHFRLNPGSELARFRLAECYRRLADSESPNASVGPEPPAKTKDYLHDKRNTHLEKAVANYQILINDLEARQHSGLPGFTEVDADLLGLARFRMAECLFNLRYYDQALLNYENLASLYQHQYEGLIACRELYRCHFVLMPAPDRERIAKAHKALERARSIWNELEDAAFKDRPESREDWDIWIKRAEQELRNLSF
jgi:tetratricopeptide (TPR) repeat protein